MSRKNKTLKVNGVTRKCPHCGNKIRVNFAIISDLKIIEYNPYKRHPYNIFNNPDYQI